MVSLEAYQADNAIRTWPEVVTPHPQNKFKSRHSRQEGSLENATYDGSNVQLRVEEMVERRARERRPGAVRELFHRPVLQRRLLVVQEDATVLHRRRPVRASRRVDEQRVVFCGRDICPPILAIRSSVTSTAYGPDTRDTAREQQHGQGRTNTKARHLTRHNER